MLRWLMGLLDRIFAVLGAALFAQAPLFMQQYTQQLVGRTAELRVQVDAMRHSASISGKTLEQLIQKFTASSDPDFVRQGEIMNGIVQRWSDFSISLTAMDGSTVWSRPLNFLYHLNMDAFKSTLDHFSLGFPLSLEGGIYAFIGMSVSYLLFATLRKLFKKAVSGCSKLFRNATSTHKETIA